MKFKILLQVAKGYEAHNAHWIFEDNEPVRFADRELAQLKYDGWLAELPFMAYNFQTALKISFSADDVVEQSFLYSGENVQDHFAAYHRFVDNQFFITRIVENINYYEAIQPVKNQETIAISTTLSSLVSLLGDDFAKYDLPE